MSTMVPNWLLPITAPDPGLSLDADSCPLIRSSNIFNVSTGDLLKVGGDIGRLWIDGGEQLSLKPTRQFSETFSAYSEHLCGLGFITREGLTTVVEANSINI